MFKRFAYDVGRALRETGAAIDRIGLRALEKPVFKEPFARHRPVMNLYEKHPAVHLLAYVAPNATVVGSVQIGQKSSVMYGAVVRGDLNDVIIGENTQIGDRAVIHTTKSVEGHVAAATVIGDNVIVGPGAALQSCVIESGASIGANAVVMEAALVEKSARVAEGAVVHPGRRIPAGQLWAGNPAVFVRDLTKGELAEIDGHADEAADNAAHHAREFMPHSEAYLAAEKLGIEDSRIRAINAAQAEYEAAARAAGTRHAAPSAPVKA